MSNDDLSTTSKRKQWADDKADYRRRHGELRVSVAKAEYERLRGKAKEFGFRSPGQLVLFMAYAYEKGSFAPFPVFSSELLAATKQILTLRRMLTGLTDSPHLHSLGLSELERLFATMQRTEKLCQSLLTSTWTPPPPHDLTILRRKFSQQ